MDKYNRDRKRITMSVDKCVVCKCVFVTVCMCNRGMRSNGKIRNQVEIVLFIDEMGSEG